MVTLGPRSGASDPPLGLPLSWFFHLLLWKYLLLFSQPSGLQPSPIAVKTFSSLHCSHSGSSGKDEDADWGEGVGEVWPESIASAEGELESPGLGCTAVFYSASRG